MNLPGGASWSASEATSLNEFLNTAVGKKWLWVMLMIKPTVDLASTDRAAMTGAFAAGYEHFLNQIAVTRTTRPDDSSASAKTIDMTKD
jgi:hypothetical protein